MGVSQKGKRQELIDLMVRRAEALTPQELLDSGVKGSTTEEKRAGLICYWRDKDPAILDMLEFLPMVDSEMVGGALPCIEVTEGIRDSLRWLLQEFLRTHLVLLVPPVAMGDECLFDPSLSPEIYRRWCPNVTLIAPDNINYMMQAQGKVQINFCPFKSLRRLLSLPEDEPLLCQHLGFELATIFFGEAAMGLIHLIRAKALQLEAHVGDVHDMGRHVTKLGEREALTLATRFDRIFMNNIPDYCTLLPSFTHLLPLLKPGKHCTLTHNVQRPSMQMKFRDLDEFIHSTFPRRANGARTRCSKDLRRPAGFTYVPCTSMMPRFLGARHEHGGIWAHLIQWSSATVTEEVGRSTSTEMTGPWQTKL
jgi:hypothetical protein